MTETKKKAEFRFKLNKGFDLTYQRLLTFKRYK